MRAVPDGFEMKKNYVIGITGSIGTGKSTVSKYLQNKGYRVLDADVIAKGELEDPEVAAEIAAVFGPEILTDGQVDRKKLGGLIFRDSEKRKKLNALIHPRVIKTIEEELESTEGLVFVDIPLLYEAGLEYLCDKILVVYASRRTQIARLTERDGIGEEYALLKIEAQMDIEEKKKLADFLVDNEGSPAETFAQTENILRRVNDEIRRLFPK